MFVNLKSILPFMLASPVCQTPYTVQYSDTDDLQMISHNVSPPGLSHLKPSPSLPNHDALATIVPEHLDQTVNEEFDSYEITRRYKTTIEELTKGNRSPVNVSPCIIKIEK
ncbi:unnamed protein product [Fusarium equiseti]|uniref:Uncharacterized protein n=1 Tax=Fusarium equiseti TaxID=61235 RepID=A0A8J2J062_FUSEQ|nr:unnamed protein product [Fusarium equiseti]